MELKVVVKGGTLAQTLTIQHSPQLHEILTPMFILPVLSVDDQDILDLDLDHVDGLSWSSPFNTS